MHSFAPFCTVLNAQNFCQKSLKILLMFSPNFANFDKFSLDFAKVLPNFCRIFAIRPRRNVQGTGRVPGGYPGGYPGGSPKFAFSRKLPHIAPPKKLASSSARPSFAAALRDLRAVHQTRVLQADPRLRLLAGPARIVILALLAPVMDVDAVLRAAWIVLRPTRGIGGAVRRREAPKE